MNQGNNASSQFSKDEEISSDIKDSKIYVAQCFSTKKMRSSTYKPDYLCHSGLMKTEIIIMSPYVEEGKITLQSSSGRTCES